MPYTRTTMHLAVLAICGILISSCGSVNPKLEYFTSDKTTINAGDTALLKWRISDFSDNTRISLNGKRVPNIGEVSVSPSSTTSYTLAIVQDSRPAVEKTLALNVIIPPPPVPVINNPAEEKINNTESEYSKGIINYENVRSFAPYSLDIIGLQKERASNMIHLFCVVRDSYGNLVSNLANPYNNQNTGFWQKVLFGSDDNLQEAQKFAVEEVRLSDAPRHNSVLVVDNSGSMTEAFPQLYEALASYFNYFRPGKDTYSIYQFDHREVLSISNAEKAENVKTLIDFEALRGGTALYSAAVNAMKSVSTTSPKSEKIALLFTDGIDNSSLFANANDVVAAANALNYRVFIVGYEQCIGCIDRQILSEIAAQTGGKAYFTGDANSLDDIFADIYQTVNSYYIVTIPFNFTNAKKQPITFQITAAGKGAVLKGSRSFYTEPSSIEEPKRAITMINFNPNSVNPLYANEPAIESLISTLKQNPEKKILIRGHSDSQGKSERNKQISMRRAQALRALLIKKGLPNKQIAGVQGLGFTEPIHPDDKDDVWKQNENRRAEIVVL